MTGKIKIDLFSDPVCPWCLIGLNRLDRAIAKLPEGVAVEIEHHPFLLDPNAPAEGQDVVEMLKQKYGREPFETWDHLENLAAEMDVPLDMRKQTTRWPSQAAQALIAAARETPHQHALARAIGDAYYLDARNISDPDVLVDLATRFGFTADDARAIVTDVDLKRDLEARAAAASRQGINGVPFFIFAEKYAFSGSQPMEVFERAFEMARGETAGA